MTVLAVALACGGEPQRSAGPKPFRVLVFTKTTGFRHDSIPAGVAAIRRLGSRHAVLGGYDARRGTVHHALLARYGAVIFLSTTGTPIKDAQTARRF